VSRSTSWERRWKVKTKAEVALIHWANRVPRAEIPGCCSLIPYRNRKLADKTQYREHGIFAAAEVVRMEYAAGCSCLSQSEKVKKIVAMALGQMGISTPMKNRTPARKGDL